MSSPLPDPQTSPALEGQLQAFQSRGWLVKERTATSAIVYPPPPPKFKLGLHFVLSIVSCGLWLIPTYVLYFQSLGAAKRQPRPQRLVVDSLGNVSSITL